MYRHGISRISYTKSCARTRSPPKFRDCHGHRNWLSWLFLCVSMTPQKPWCMHAAGSMFFFYLLFIASIFSVLLAAHTPQHMYGDRQHRTASCCLRCFLFGSWFLAICCSCRNLCMNPMVYIRSQQHRTVSSTVYHYACAHDAAGINLFLQVVGVIGPFHFLARLQKILKIISPAGKFSTVELLNGLSNCGSCILLPSWRYQMWNRLLSDIANARFAGFPDFSGHRPTRLV